MNRLCSGCLFLTVFATVSFSQPLPDLSSPNGPGFSQDDTRLSLLADPTFLDLNRVTATDTEINFRILLNEALYSLIYPRHHHPSWPEYGYTLAAITRDPPCRTLNRRGDFPIGAAALVYAKESSYEGFLLPLYDEGYRLVDDFTLRDLCLHMGHLDGFVDLYEPKQDAKWYLITENAMPTTLKPEIRVQLRDYNAIRSDQ